MLPPVYRWWNCDGTRRWFQTCALNHLVKLLSQQAPDSLSLGLVHCFILASRSGGLVGQLPSLPYLMFLPTTLSLMLSSINIIPWNIEKLNWLTRPSNFSSPVLGRRLDLGRSLPWSSDLENHRPSLTLLSSILCLHSALQKSNELLTWEHSINCKAPPKIKIIMSGKQVSSFFPMNWLITEKSWREMRSFMAGLVPTTVLSTKSIKVLTWARHFYRYFLFSETRDKTFMTKLLLHLLIFWRMLYLLWAEYLELDLDRWLHWDSDAMLWFHKHQIVLIFPRHLATCASVWPVGQGQVSFSWSPFCHMDPPQDSVDESQQIHRPIINNSKCMPCWVWVRLRGDL